MIKATYNGSKDVSNWTFGKEYNATRAFVKGYVFIIDDNGGEQLIPYGSTNFLWD